MIDVQPHATKIGTIEAEGTLNLRARVLEENVLGALAHYLMNVAAAPLKVRTHTSGGGQYLKPGCESSL